MALVSGVVSLTLKPASGGEINLAVGLGETFTTLESKDLNFGQPGLRHQIKWLIFEIGDYVNSQLNITLRYRNRVNAPFKETARKPIPKDGSPVFFRYPKSRYVRLKIEDLGVTELWKLSKIECWGNSSKGRR